METRRRRASCRPSTRSTTRSPAAIPEQGPATIVHGDYRLDNCMVGDDGDVVAVLDWEICTLGDPLADVGLLMVYWTEPGDEPTRAGPARPPPLAGLPRPRRAARPLRRASPAATCRDIDFYVAFGYWKLACILEGVYARYLGGAMGDRDRARVRGLRAPGRRRSPRQAARARSERLR